MKKLTVPKQLPVKFQWLLNEHSPKMLVEALRHYGILEHTGKGSNPNILAWAKELGVSGWYTDDDIPWCALFASIVISRSGYEIPKGLDLLGAIHFINFGNKVERGSEMLFDILIFLRPGGNHIGFYIGENTHAFLVYGGNQSNAVGFAWIDKKRLIAARRPVWKAGQPANIRKIILSETGDYSTNEQ